ncbi:MAG: gliding motility-associated C-terminal domain-containing protein [Daejeonella sp.]
MNTCKHLLLLISIIYFANGVQAQTCTGSLGEPVVQITFGTSATAPGPLAFGTTSYLYAGSNCPDDGYYRIESQTPGCFGATWHQVTEDHTPNDAGGNMMLINASIEPGDFFKQKVSGLCGGTTYEFSAYVMNMLRIGSCNAAGSKPNITFSIEDTKGVILNSYNTKDIPEDSSPVWKNFGFYFKTPSNISEVVIKMTNNALGGCGNDLALDDITFRACGPAIFPEASTVNAGNKLCEAEPGIVNLNAEISSGYTNPAFQWQVNFSDGSGWNDIAGATQKFYTYQIDTADKPLYKFRLAVAEVENINSVTCRVLSDSLLVEVTPKPVADAGLDLFLLEGNSIKLNGTAAGENISYYWTPADYLDDPTSLNPIASPKENTLYQLNVFSNNGCDASSSDQVFIRVLKNLVIPNAFSPNGDQINDKWQILALNTYPEANIKVFNRYGKIVFNSLGYAQEWDGTFEGKSIPTGVYYYIIDLKNNTELISGNVTIFR